MRYIDINLLTPKEHCEGWDGPCENTNAKWIRQGSSYEDDERNVAYLCHDCEKDCIQYWTEMRMDYQNAVLPLDDYHEPFDSDNEIRVPIIEFLKDFGITQ